MGIERNKLANSTDALRAAAESLQEVARRGRRAVLLVRDVAAVDRAKRELAAWGLGIGVSVATVASWTADLWELHGDGRAFVEPMERLARIWRALDVGGDVQDGALLPRTPGCACMLAQLAQDALPFVDEALMRSPARPLAESERAAVLLVREYGEGLARDGLVEPCQAQHALAAMARADGHGLGRIACATWGIRVDELAFAAQGLLVAVGTQAFEDGLSRPNAASRAPEIQALLTTLFCRGAGTPPVRPEGAVRLAFAAGPTSRVQSLVDVAAQAVRDFPDAAVAVAAVDPCDTFLQAAPRLLDAGIACGLRGSVAFSETATGRALSGLAALVADDAPDVFAATDYAFDPLSGTFYAAAFRADARRRGNRIIDRDDVLSSVAETSGDAMKGAVGLAEEGDWQGVCDLLEAQAARCFAPSPALLARELAALRLGRSCAAACGREGADGAASMRDVLGLIAGQPVPFSCETQPGAPVLFTTAEELAAMPAGSCAVVVFADMEASSRPVKPPENALRTLLGKLGCEPAADPLRRARETFFHALECATGRVVLSRVLVLPDAAPASPAMMLDEVIDCYRASLTDDADMLRDLHITRGLAPYATQAGELSLMRNACGRDTQRQAISVPAPNVGELSPGNRGRIAVPYRYKTGYAPGVDLSPSQVESYLECPYEWFAKRRLRLVGIDEGFTQLERGTFMHSVLKHFYEAFRLAGHAKVTQENLDEAQDVMRREFAASAARQPSHDPGNRYVAATPTEQRRVDELGRSLVSYLDWEAGFLPGFAPKLLEWEFGRVSPVPYAGCNLRGTVDRVDVDEAGRAVVIDYKSSLSDAYALRAANAEDGAPFTLPRKMQALVYAQVVQRVLGCTVVGALYVNPLKPQVRGAFDDRILGPESLPFESVRAAERCGISACGFHAFGELLDECEAQAAAGLARLAAGEVAPAPHGEDACEYCPVALCPMRLAPMKGGML